MYENGLLGIFCVALLFLVSLVWFAEDETDRLRSEAVERGYAEWVVDSSGHAEWRWVEGE